MRSLLILGALLMSTAAEAQMKSDWKLVVHGGAGVIRKDRITPEKDREIRAALDRALAAGSLILEKGGSALDAVEASVKVLEESATPDVQCVFAPASYKPGLIRKLDDVPGITGGPFQMRPLSRGYVLARTPDPHDQPAINPRYLAEETDRRAIVAAGVGFHSLIGCV